MKMSRNSRGANEVDKQFSANSTVKIDLNSQGGNEVPNINTAEHKIISPESQMGQVYQKTNLAIHQRGLRYSNKIQKTSSPRDVSAGRYIYGVTMTDFNSNLNFDTEQTEPLVGRTRH